jgi:uncharacterized protein YqhQ
MSEIPEMPTGSSNGASSNGAGRSEEKLRLGGMALRNGLLVHGPTSWAVAARSRGGEIEYASGPKPDFGGNRVAKIPLLRGPVRMAEAFAVIPIARRALPSSRLPFEDGRVLAAAAIASLAGNALRGRSDEPISPGREAIVSLIGLLPAGVALSGTELAAYHAVEHKAIAAYEQGVEDPAAVAKEHQRCGSNLIAPLLVFSLAGQLLLERLVAAPGRLGRAAVSLAGLSLSVEVFAYAERNPDSALGRAVHASGDAIQRLFATREPTPEQLEVGIVALDAVLAAESG